MKKLLLGLVATSLVGCAYSPYQALTIEEYKYYGEISAFAEKCHNIGKVDSKLLSDYSSSFQRVISIRDYDPEKLKNVYKRKAVELLSDSDVNCINTEYEIYNVINHSNTIIRNQDVVHEHPLQKVADALNPPRVRTTCTTVQGVTRCN